MNLGLDGRRTLVTGSWRGTGLIIAKRFAEEGADVFVHGFTEDTATEAAAEIAGSTPVWGDITNDAGAEAVTSACADVDILINNYGAAERGSWEKSTADDWIKLYEINVLSALRLIRHYLPGMRAAGWGRIINLGTVGSTRPNARMPHYYAAKGALANMTVSLAKEVANSGIRVNLVSPGLILTPEVEQQYLEVGKRKGWGETWEEIEPHVAADTLIGRIVRREEVADLVLFMASERADALHAQNVRIDGGSLDIVS